MNRSEAIVEYQKAQKLGQRDYREKMLTGQSPFLPVLDDILQEPFFLTEKHANYRQALDQQLALRRQSISPVLEISDTEFIIRMLELNQGLSFLPYFAVEQDIYKHRIITLDVKDVHISMYRQIFYHKNKFRTREMEEFIRLADKRS